jgi:hypothetical protein
MSLVLAPRPPYIVARLPGNLLAAKYRRRCADRFCWSREVVTLVHRKFSHLQQLSMKLEARFRCWLRGTQSALGVLWFSYQSLVFSSR